MHGTELLLIKAALFLDSIGHVLSRAVAFDHNVTELNEHNNNNTQPALPITNVYRSDSGLKLISLKLAVVPRPSLVGFSGQLWYCVCQWAGGGLLILPSHGSHITGSSNCQDPSSSHYSSLYSNSSQSLLANSCFILWQLALMKSQRSLQTSVLFPYLIMLF